MYNLTAPAVPHLYCRSAYIRQLLGPLNVPIVIWQVRIHEYMASLSARLVEDWPESFQQVMKQETRKREYAGKKEPLLGTC